MVPNLFPFSFGHKVTKANVKHHSASTQFYSAPANHLIRLNAEVTNCNPPAKVIHGVLVSRIHKLRSCPFGGLLVVVKHWNAETASLREHIVQDVARQAIAPLGKLLKPFQSFWL